MAADPPFPRSSPPTAIRLAQAALLLLAGLTLLAGLGSAAICAGIPLGDPTLGGDASLAVSVLLATGLLWAAGGGLTVVAALSLGAGHPAGRWLASAVAALLVLSPLFPLGLVVLWATWLDEDGRRWGAAA